jgi:3-hydroxybutyryl-CoA dehydrogenase
MRKVGVVGCGTMGAGIAIVSARAGFETRVFDTRQEAIVKAKKNAADFLQKSVERGRLDADQLPLIMDRWHGSSDFADIADCDFVIEAVLEDLHVKHAVFSELNKLCANETIFASNTSTISITEIAGGSGRADRFVGMHFCLPAQLMKLVEMSPGLNTSAKTWSVAWNFALALGQKPVKTQDTPGFVLNYFLIPFNNDAIRLVEQGVAEPGEIDKAIKTAMGYPMGPLELVDLIGTDTQRLLCDAMHGLTHESRAACPPLVRRMIAAGRLGKKSGRGFYEYSDQKMFGA